MSTALTFTPDSTYSVELADYDDSSIGAASSAKNSFCFVGPYIDVTSGTSNTVFNVSSAADIQEGFLVRVHNDDLY
jgi:hypothetical protein